MQHVYGAHESDRIDNSVRVPREIVADFEYAGTGEPSKGPGVRVLGACLGEVKSVPHHSLHLVWELSQVAQA
jgi:hypothetical protein